jgi:hypothetical protein
MKIYLVALDTGTSTSLLPLGDVMQADVVTEAADKAEANRHSPSSCG